MTANYFKISKTNLLKKSLKIITESYPLKPKINSLFKRKINQSLKNLKITIYHAKEYSISTSRLHLQHHCNAHQSFTHSIHK
ncbi:hypothetical protein CAXC1_110019 [Candidatus Xenohaliotis californiensis]|uniref:Uncharacterized protein n=1 Tax=Candidatus Xenohaliotis californiensis TaxID=84677 RepID=A0ABP0ERK5_9RICK|nr:hypothetical protein CAXC1_110019 [Candidatus Xenohaliotis californiensis]